MRRSPALSTRLPGLRFEVVRPQRADALPRMDIAAFVGFAASGPVHVPVLVEDVAQFESIYGDDLPLAWDAERGEQVYAYLAPAVRAFFRNGGRRCWVIRVASDTAHIAWFPIPGLAQFDGKTLLPAFAPARSPGVWAEALRLGAALVTEPILMSSTKKPDMASMTLDLFLRIPNQVVVGDLLRLTYLDEEKEKTYTLFFPVSKLDPLESDTDSLLTVSAHPVRVYADKLFCFRSAELPPGKNGSLTAYSHTGIAGTATAHVPEKPDTLAENRDRTGDADSPISLDVTGMSVALLQTACLPGALVRVDFGDSNAGQAFWMLVEGCTVNDSPIDHPSVHLTGRGMWQVTALPDFGTPDLVERLTFEIWARQPQRAPRHLSDLGFTASQPRFWAALPTDEQLYLAQASATTGDSSFEEHPKKDAAFRELYAGLWQSAQTPRFPLAARYESRNVFLPLLIETIPGPYASPDEAPGDTLTSEGLDNYCAGLFLDPDLADVETQALLEKADYLRYTHTMPRHLRGVHAALSVDEVTLIAVPDAVHRGWQKPETASPPSLPDFERSLCRPEWWHFAPCQPSIDIKPISHPDWGKFQRCSIQVIDVPNLSSRGPDSGGSFILRWQAIGDPEPVYILQESTLPDFSDARILYRGTDTQYSIYGYPQGDYYFRVRAERINAAERSSGARIVESSDWSYGVRVSIATGSTWRVKSIVRESSQQTPGDAAILRAVQLNLLRMCEARGDMFAVLSMPGHLREQESIHYALGLRSPLSKPIAVDVLVRGPLAEMKKAWVAGIGYGEAHNLGFGALYHPWLYSTDNVSGVARLNPPDGYIVGILAQRAYERGAWIAPANQPLRSVIALEPALHSDRWLDIQEARINLIRQEPQGFLTLSERTLSDDPDWSLINVRRLISLIRRLAQHHGYTWVFEPNEEALARLIKRTFVSLLDQMFARGAFAGRTPESSYQVDVQVTPKDIDEGRFIVELRVAPSLPMRFITIQLIQSGEHSQVTEGG